MTIETINPFVMSTVTTIMVITINGTMRIRINWTKVPITIRNMMDFMTIETINPFVMSTATTIMVTPINGTMTTTIVMMTLYRTKTEKLVLYITMMM